LEDLIKDIENGRSPPTILSVGADNEETETGWRRLDEDLVSNGTGMADIK